MAKLKGEVWSKYSRDPEGSELLDREVKRGKIPQGRVTHPRGEKAFQELRNISKGAIHSEVKECFGKW